MFGDRDRRRDKRLSTSRPGQQPTGDDSTVRDDTPGRAVHSTMRGYAADGLIIDEATAAFRDEVNGYAWIPPVGAAAPEPFREQR